MQKTTVQYLAGILISLIAAVVATAVNAWLPLLSPMVVAILLGVLLRNTGLLPAVADPGLKFTAKKILRIGVVLLGLRLSIPAVLGLGWGAIAVILITVACVFTATLMIGRAARISHATTLLTATGTAICGAAAVAGMSSVVRSTDQDDDVEDAAATAIASVTIFGTLEIFLLPLLVNLLGFAATAAGVWAGAAVHEVGQVVATAGSMSQEILDIAVVTKLGRVVLLAPLVALVGVIEGRNERKRREAQADASLPGSHMPADEAGPKTPIIPLFVLGFLAMVVVRALTDSVVPVAVFDGFNTVATFLLTMAMFAMGSDVRLRRIVTTGLPALVLGVVASVISLIVSLGCVMVFVA